MSDDYMEGKLILGRRVRVWRGCGGCPMRSRNCIEALDTTVVELRHTGDECWDNWGRTVSVFEPDEVVEVRVCHDADTVYCATATSTCYPGTSDFVWLANFAPATGA